MMLLNTPPAPRPVVLVSRYQPTAYRPHGMGQLVEVTPQIDAPITIELGGLPLSLGFFAGTGVALLIGWQVPKARGVASVIAIGLGIAGVVNLLVGGAKGAEAAEQAVAPVTPGGVSAPLPDTVEEAFALVTGRVVSPVAGTVVDAGLGAPTIPVRARVSNPSNSPVTFDLILQIDEQPEGLSTSETTTETTRVQLGAGETRDFDVDFQMVTWDWDVFFARVTVWIGKQRLEGGDVEFLDQSRISVD